MFWEKSERRPTPKKSLKKMVYQRDKGKCQICETKVNPFDFEIGHNLAHSKGGKLTVKNAILLCSTCNKSMRTLSLKQARKKLGLPETDEEKTLKALKKLNLRELKYLAKTHRIKLRSKVIEGVFRDTVSAPSKRQYINALSKELKEEQITEELKEMPKEEPKRKRRRN